MVFYNFFFVFVIFKVWNYKRFYCYILKCVGMGGRGMLIRRLDFLDFDNGRSILSLIFDFMEDRWIFKKIKVL